MYQVPGLRRTRRQRVMTIRDLAQAAGVSPVTIVELEKGKRLARATTVHKLAVVLGVSAQELAVPVEEVGEG